MSTAQPLVFEWDVYGQEDLNPVRVDTTGASSDNFSYQANSVANPFTLSLTVTDAAGGSGSTSLDVNPAGYGCGYNVHDTGIVSHRCCRPTCRDDP